VQRMTRGLSDSPFLPSIELSSTTIYRLTLAHSYLKDTYFLGGHCGLRCCICGRHVDGNLGDGLSVHGNAATT